MKKALFIITMLIKALVSYSQRTEFPLYSNGLIYNDTTMKRLHFIVDSLHLKFKSCDLTGNYYSVKQTVGHYIILDTGNIKAALADIKNEIGYEHFIQKYPLAKVDSNNLITATYEKDKKGNILAYTSATSEDYNAPCINILADSTGAIKTGTDVNTGQRGRWIFRYTQPDKYSTGELEAFYCPQFPLAVTIPDKYARMILYADCMIDTNTSVFTADARYGSFAEEKKGGPKLEQFWQYLADNTRKIEAKYHKKRSRKDSWSIIDSLKETYIRDSLSAQPAFKRLLADAVTEVMETKCETSDEFEYYTARYYSKDAALTMKRNRIVMGFCSQDQRPREHAMEIALLAAEAANWNVFLKAHLNIMNDRFARMSDGSYAWGSRKTYLKELEDLDINVQDLMLGIALRISNPAENHYYGSIQRQGRAFAETNDRPGLESKMISMITDTTLDNYNRLIMHYLFLHYLFYLPEKESRLAALRKLEEADKTLPAWLLPKIKVNREVMEEGTNRER